LQEFIEIYQKFSKLAQAAPRNKYFDRNLDASKIEFAMRYYFYQTAILNRKLITGTH